MKTREEIQARIIRVLVETFELETSAVHAGASLYDDLDLDSLDAIDLAVKLKTETGIKLTEQEMRSIRTVSDIVDIVHENLAKTRSAG